MVTETGYRASIQTWPGFLIWVPKKTCSSRPRLFPERLLQVCQKSTVHPRPNRTSAKLVKPSRIRKPQTAENGLIPCFWCPTPSSNKSTLLTQMLRKHKTYLSAATKHSQVNVGRPARPRLRFLSPDRRKKTPFNSTSERCDQGSSSTARQMSNRTMCQPKTPETRRTALTN